MRKLLLLAFGVMVALPALSQLDTKTYTQKSRDWEMIGNDDFPAKLTRKGYVFLGLTAADTATYIYTITRTKKEFVGSGPFVLDLRTPTEYNGPYLLSQLSLGYVCCTFVGNWLKYTIDLSKLTPRKTVSIEFSYAMAGTGYVELRSGSPTGPLITPGINLPATGDWNKFSTVEVAVSIPQGKQELYVVFPKNQSHGNFKTLTFK